jgi:hypothetical protein
MQGWVNQQALQQLRSLGRLMEVEMSYERHDQRQRSIQLQSFMGFSVLKTARKNL